MKHIKVVKKSGKLTIWHKWVQKLLVSGDKQSIILGSLLVSDPTSLIYWSFFTLSYQAVYLPPPPYPEVPYDIRGVKRSYPHTRQDMLNYLIKAHEQYEADNME